MPIYETFLDTARSTSFVELRDFLPQAKTLLKIEGLNIAGSIKLKTAIAMIEDLERSDTIEPGRSTLVESSSGNLGVAISVVARAKGYRFICVSDPNITRTNAKLIQAYGAELVLVAGDPTIGHLQARLSMVNEIVKSTAGAVWLNQYANPSNISAHADGTAMEIASNIQPVDFVFVGCGTTGTAMGLAQYFRQNHPATKVIGVEPEGSVTFSDDPPSRRLIPGIGTSRRPELAQRRALHQVVYVPEEVTLRACWALRNRYGFLAGGSTGSVLAAVLRVAEQIPPGAQVVAVSPDMGDRYVDTIYCEKWVMDHYGLSLDSVVVGDDLQAALKTIWHC